MGIIPNWQNNVLSAVLQLNETAFIYYDNLYQIVQCSPKVHLHLISLHNNFHPDDVVDLQRNYQHQGKLLVQLWEDVWLNKKNQVLSRIASFLSLNETVFARKTKIITLNHAQASDFLNIHHLQGYVKAKYHYGLTINDTLIAVASFSHIRPMKSKGTDYKSVELVRFASKNGYTITGGLSKLIKYFITLIKPNDMMSYADRDWSLGKGYNQLGFKLSASTAPAYLYLSIENGIRYFPHRLPNEILSAFKQQKALNLDDYLASKGFVKLFNTGNLKYHLYI